MKFFFTFLSFLCLVAPAASPAFAGTEGHGGGGVVCTDPVTRATTVELLDFYQGEARGLTIPRSDDISVSDQLNAAYAKLKSIKSDPDQIRDSVKDTLKHAHFVDVDNFPVPHDTGEIDLPPTCRLVGIVNYQDHLFAGPTITVNARLFYRLSNTDQAGLWFHEAGYWIYREYLGDLGKNSVEAQRLTAITFSTETNYETPLWPAKKY